MRLTELKIEKYKDFSTRSLGPFQNGLNFVYGERHAGKSTICDRFRKLYANMQLPPGQGFGLTASFVDGVRGQHTAASTTANGFPVVDRGLIDAVYCASFGSTDFSQLRQTLASAFNVQSDNSKELASQEAARVELQRNGLLQKIQQLESELALLATQRSERLSAGASNHARLADLESQIQALTLQLSGLDAGALANEIANSERELVRLRAEIVPAPVVRQTDSPLPAMYRTLDEIEAQMRELRSIQLNVQQHRVRLKEEMEQWKQVSMDQQVHPYHNTRDILQHIETRIDSVNGHAQQWAEDHSAVDSQMVQRFLSETCQSIRTDLQNLCDELSVQYREIRQRSATLELKQLRESYNQIEESMQRIMSRRSGAVEQIRSKDPAGAAAIENPSNDYSRVAIHKGNLTARTQVVGALPEQQSVSLTAHAESGLRTQQIAALESRLNSLRLTATNQQGETMRITQQIAQLRTDKDALAYSAPATADLDQRIEALRREIDLLRQQMASLKPAPVPQPVRSPVLDVASEILNSLTAAEYVRMDVELLPGTFSVVNHGGSRMVVESATERGLKDIVRLAIVLASAQLGSSGSEFPLVCDDLFAELSKSRIPVVLDFLNAWCQKFERQIIVLTQHRFLADQLPSSAFFDLESVQQTNHLAWQAVSRETVPSIPSVAAVVPSPAVQTPVVAQAVSASLASGVGAGSWDFEQWPVESVAEYPRSPLPRPYPLSKYPRTLDRDRFANQQMVPESSWMEYEYPIVQQTRPSMPAPIASIVPSQITSPSEIVCVDDASTIESLGMFNPQQLRCLIDLNVRNVADFLSLVDDPENREMARCYLSGDSLSNFQSAAWLMMWIPGVSSVDAQALVACGISEPSHLLTSNIDSLNERVSRFLRSTEGRKYSSRSSLSRDSLSRWQSTLRSSRNYRNQDRQSYRRSNSHRLRAFQPRENESEDRAARDYSPRPPRMDASADRVFQAPARLKEDRQSDRQSDRYSKPRAVRQTPRQQKPAAESQPKPRARKLKFYLDLTDHIEAAPSIGPRTAERFEAIGIHTISEFLKVTAEALAERLDYKRLNANVVRQYQHQTRLVCRIPNLRGHDAQLLVGCGVVDAEELASMRPDALFERVAPFSDTKEGLKIIRNGKKPDLAEVTDWIEFAQHNRSLQAA